MCFEIIGKASGKIWQIKPFHGFFYRIITNVCRTPFSWSTSINGVRNGIVSNDILSTQLSMMGINMLHKSLCYLKGQLKCQWLKHFQTEIGSENDHCIFILGWLEMTKIICLCTTWLFHRKIILMKNGLKIEKVLVST